MNITTLMYINDPPLKCFVCVFLSFNELLSKKPSQLFNFLAPGCVFLHCGLIYIFSALSKKNKFLKLIHIFSTFCLHAKEKCLFPLLLSLILHPLPEGAIILCAIIKWDLYEVLPNTTRF